MDVEIEPFKRRGAGSEEMVGQAKLIEVPQRTPIQAASAHFVAREGRAVQDECAHASLCEMGGCGRACRASADDDDRPMLRTVSLHGIMIRLCPCPSVGYTQIVMAHDTSEHWNRVYAEKDPTEASWYQQSPTRSLELIDAALADMCSEPDRPRHILDVGGGASKLVDCLLERPGVELCVLDIAAGALDHAKTRLGDRADRVKWIEADATGPLAAIRDSWADVWHDRAVFHFLTTPEARLGYAKNLARILRPSGVAVIATFALNGPLQCSGLEVCRHDGASILRELVAGGADLTLEKEDREEHTTPWGSVQSFVYTVLRRG